MPKVGNNEYPYTPEGKQEAAGAATPEQATQAEMDAGKARGDMVGGSAPQAEEPLEPTRVNALAQAVAAAIASLTDGSIPAPDFAEITEAVDQLPAEVFAPLVAIAQFFESGMVSGFEQYAFDPTQLAVSNEGLAELATLVSAMSGDEKLKQAMKAGPPAPQGEAPAPPQGGMTEEEISALA